MEQKLSCRICCSELCKRLDKKTGSIKVNLCGTGWAYWQSEPCKKNTPIGGIFGKYLTLLKDWPTAECAFHLLLSNIYRLMQNKEVPT
jgi:hypothetical protein